jgi:TPR repeat protein
MKRYYILSLVIILGVNYTFAQNCYDKTRNKGITAYDNGEFTNAIKYFKFAVEDCPDKPADNDLQAWISKCETAIKQKQQEEAQRAKETEQKKREEARKREPTLQVHDTEAKIEEYKPIQTTFLSVSTDNLSFDASGVKEFSIDLSTNASTWTLSNVISWCNASITSESSLRLVCEPNLTEEPRYDTFYIIAGDKQAKINITQQAMKDPLALGDKFYKEGKYDEAKRLYTISADKGNKKGQYLLGKMYLEGTGVAASSGWAMILFRKSAGQKYAPGENGLGYIYEMQKDYAKAAEWYRKSAEQGYATAQYNLGIIYLYGGYGVKQNKAEAKKWLKKSAEQGFTKAIEELQE